MEFKPVTSRENPTFKKIKALREPRKAHKAGLILVEGFRQVEDALASGIVPTWFLIRQDALQNDRWPTLEIALKNCLDRAEAHSIELLRLDDRLFNDLAATASPQGVALVAPEPILLPAALSDLSMLSNALYLALEAIQDPGNLGTLIRTADAFAFAGVLLTGPSADPYSDKALRAAMGSTFHLPIIRFSDIDQAADWLDAKNIPLIAADLSGDALTQDLILPQSAALVIGNEGSGLTVRALSRAKHRLKIPMPGRAESLNAAAAAAILCYRLASPRI